MKFFLAIFSCLAITTSSLVNTAFVNNVDKKEKNSVNVSETNNFKLNLAKASEEYILKNKENESFLKELVLNSIKIVDGRITLKNDNFLLIKDEELYSFLINPEFANCLQDLFIKDQLIVVNSNELIFKEQESKISIAPYYSTGKVWTEAHWYWFGYWKLYFNYEAAIFMANLLDDGASNFVEIAQSIMSSLAPPLSAPTVLALAIFALIWSWQFRQLLYSNPNLKTGLVVHWIFLVPTNMTYLLIL